MLPGSPRARIGFQSRAMKAYSSRCYIYSYFPESKKTEIEIKAKVWKELAEELTAAETDGLTTAD